MSNLPDCNAKKCGQSLPENELWSCADCAELFCESHIADLLDDHRELVAVGEKGSIYVCGACLIGRAQAFKLAA
jgi:hypothetical protein